MLKGWMLEFIACSEYFAGYDNTILQKSNNPYKCSKQVFVRMCNIRFIVNKNIPPAQLGRKHAMPSLTKQAMNKEDYKGVRWKER